MVRPRRMALVAFCLHHPGVRLLYGRRQSPWLRRRNAQVLVGTLVAAALAGWLMSWFAALVAFAAGHFVWSGMYASLIVARGDSLFLNGTSSASNDA